MLIESALFVTKSKLEARPKINLGHLVRNEKNLRFKGRMKEKVKSWITLTIFYYLQFFIFASS